MVIYAGETATCGSMGSVLDDMIAAFWCCTGLSSLAAYVSGPLPVGRALASASFPLAMTASRGHVGARP